MEYKVENISKKYGKKIVLKQFNYVFKEGIYLLIGANGSGKSTTLKILAKIIKPTNYNYYLSNLKVAYLCEKIELGSGKSFNYLNTIKKINKSFDDVKVLMSEWGLDNKKISSLSKGNKQKCAIIMMALTDADVYLFDEPTDALDTKSINLFVRFIKKLKEQNKIVIIATHEKKYFESICYQEVNLNA